MRQRSEAVQRLRVHRTGIREKIRDRQVLGLIRRYLTAGVVLPDGTREPTGRGVPQGGPLSPLLANITLDPLDKELERRGHRSARYADVICLLLGSPGRGPDGDAQSQGVLADELQQSRGRGIQRALTNDWLHAQGVPDMRTSWIVLHYGPHARV